MTVRAALRRGIARVAPGGAAPGVRVLMYHAVDEPDPADTMALRVTRSAFDAQLALLEAGPYHVVPLARVFDPPVGDGRMRVAITFDDGYRSQAWAADRLRARGFPATFFVVPRFLDGGAKPGPYWERWAYLGWDEAAALAEQAFEIGAHSATHPDLRRCDDDRLEEEIGGAKRRLETRLRRPVVSFSYPGGRHDGRVRDAVRRAGFARACTSRYGVNRASAAPFRLHRTEVTGRDTLRDFQWKLEGKYDWLAYWQGMRTR